MSGECDSSGVCEGNAEGRMKNAEMLGAAANLTAYAWRSGRSFRLFHSTANGEILYLQK